MMKISRRTRRVARKILPAPLVERLRPSLAFDNTYPWLNYAFSRVVRDARCRFRPQYAWGVAQGAALARVLGVPRISVIEFGVAGGFGLRAMECAARSVEKLTGVGIEVFGFDSAAGLPGPRDLRDQPNMWFEGQLPMDRTRLESALTRATLVLGRVEDTVPAFIASDPPPVAFVSFDLDLYSSTRDALAIFEADHRQLLPRVLSYFDDIFGYTYNDFSGERLAIREFNDREEKRKICAVDRLRYFLPRSVFHDLWPDGMHFTHFFDHPRYGVLDSIRKPMFMDLQGNFIEAPERRRMERRTRALVAASRERTDRRKAARRAAGQV